MDRRLEEGPDGVAGRGRERIRLRAVPRSDRGKHAQAKPLQGFGSAGVLEVVEDWRGNTYRMVYTVRFAVRVFVLHVFQKKSKSGIATPKPDLDLIKARLKVAAKRAKELEDE
jgi:phage-related protein